MVAPQRALTPVKLAPETGIRAGSRSGQGQGFAGKDKVQGREFIVIVAKADTVSSSSCFGIIIT
jgi:hypothetical protein